MNANAHRTFRSILSTLDGVGINSAFQAMADPQFGVQVQGLHPFSLLQDGVIQLV